MFAIKKLGVAGVLLAAFGTVQAAEYVIDGTGAGMHSSVSFRASHVGISSLWGRFDEVSGTFSYDPAKLDASKISVKINPASINTNHEARDTHLSSADYLDVQKFPEAGFESTHIMAAGDKLHVVGNFTLHGVTKEISFEAVKTGEGETPFGDYRVGFEADATINAQDYGINLMPNGTLRLILAIEGIRQ